MWQNWMCRQCKSISRVFPYSSSAANKDVHMSPDKKPKKPCLAEKIINNVRSTHLGGKNVVYVGGYGAIGYACCKKMIQDGIKQLTVLDIKENCRLRRCLQITEPELILNFVKLDLRDGTDAIEEALAETIKTMPQIDILVNGSNYIDDRDPKQTVDVNLIGVVETTLLAIPLMSIAMGHKGGLIVNVASVWGLEPAGCIATYTAAKHAVVGFSRSLAHSLYLSHTGIAHMVICPGPTESPNSASFVGKDTFHFSRSLSEKMNNVKKQSADECGKEMAKAINSFENGSVWIVDLGTAKKVKMATYWQNPFGKL